MTDILSRLAALTAKDANGCLPCPFCTNAPEIHRYESHFASFGTSFQIECSHEDCPVEASSAALPSAEEAIEDWNHNHSGSKVIALVQEAAGEIERLRKCITQRIKYLEDVSASNQEYSYKYRDIGQFERMHNIRDIASSQAYEARCLREWLEPGEWLNPLDEEAVNQEGAA